MSNTPTPSNSSYTSRTEVFAFYPYLVSVSSEKSLYGSSTRVGFDAVGISSLHKAAMGGKAKFSSYSPSHRNQSKLAPDFLPAFPSPYFFEQKFSSLLCKPKIQKFFPALWRGAPDLLSSYLKFPRLLP